MATATIIPLLFLVSGYSFLTCWNIAQWNTARQIGHRLYLRIALYGIIMFIAALLVFVILWPQQLQPLYINYHLHQIKPNVTAFDFTPYAVLIVKIECLDIIIGLFGGYLLTYLSTPWRNQILRLALKDDDLELLVIRAMEKSMPISVTCANGKVYVGYVTHGFEPHILRNNIKIMPLLSGYREIDDFKV